MNNIEKIIDQVDLEEWIEKNSNQHESDQGKSFHRSTNDRFTNMNKQDIPNRIEELRGEYKRLMNRTDMSNDIAPQHHEFWWEGNYLTIDLNFIDMDSPTGFPYRRLTCLMKVNGKKISKRKLDEIFSQED